MCCLKNQQKRQLSTLMWRFNLMAKRSKKARGLAVYLQMGIAGAALTLCILLFKGKPANIATMQNYIVSGSNFNEDGSVTLLSESSPDTGPSTTQDFTVCRSRNARSIGLVYNSDLPDESFDILQSIFDDTNNAFLATQDDKSIGMKQVLFNSRSELDDFVTEKNYQADALCFALQWEKFDTSNSEEPIFELEFLTTLGQANMTNPNDSQDHYALYKYSQSSILSFGATDFLQVMATATSKIVDQVNPPEKKSFFNVLYTQLNTGDYTSVTADPCGFMVALSFEMLMLGSSALLQFMAEPREDIIEVILKRLGVQKSVLVARSFIVQGIYLIVFSSALVLLYWVSAYRGQLGLGVMFTFVIMAQLQSLVRLNLVDNVAPKSYGIIINSLYIIFAVAIGQMVIQGTPTRNTVIIGCFISPMVQLVNVFMFAYISLGFDRSLGFGEFTTEVIPGVTLLVVFWVSLFMLVFWSLLLLYLWPLYVQIDEDNPARWYYLCSPKFWCSKKKQSQLDLEQDSLDDEKIPLTKNTFVQTGAQKLDQNRLESSTLQPEEVELVKQGIVELPAQSNDSRIGRLEITGLNKIYGKKKVVNDLSFTIYTNEVLVLLGHNGAGKTTTLNMLTGLCNPTSGTAMAHNLKDQPVDLFNEYSNIVDLIGLCPQIDVLFEALTVRENLLFYCKLKNMSDMDDVVNNQLNQFNLIHKSESLASDLSGGQKRKLQLAVALLGDSKIVLLDEPTSGMDPTARRETWEIIKQCKQGKMIILTTHYMDEAEYLADRVAVISKGALKICGTSRFLKQKFGRFLYLEVEPAGGYAAPNQALINLLETANNKDQLPDESNLIIEEERKSEKSNRESSFVDTDEPVQAQIDESGRIVYKLGYHMVEHFERIFGIIDSDLARFGIKSYSIRNMTLEQVFIAIGDREQAQERKDQDAEENETASMFEESLLREMPQKVATSGAQKFYAVLTAHFQSVWQSSVPMCLGLIFLFSIVIFGCTYLPLTFKSFQVVDYSSYEGIFGEKQYNVRYNAQYSNGQENLLAQSLLASQTGINGETDEQWVLPDQTQQQNVTQYLYDVGNTIPSNSQEIAAYLIEADETNSGLRVEAAIYVNSSSPSAAPLFGNLLMQSIAQSATDKPKLRLNFKYTVWKQNLKSFMSYLPVYAFPLVQIANMLYYMQEEVVIHSTIQAIQQSGFIKNMMMRGGSRHHYCIAYFICSLVLSIVLFLIYYFTQWVYGVDVTDWEFYGIFFIIDYAIYLTCWSSLNIVRPNTINIQQLISFISYMTLAMTVADLMFIALKPGLKWSNIISLLMIGSPCAQLFIGCYVAQFRQLQYVLQMNADGNIEQAEENQETIGFFSKYGARNNLVLMFVQIVIFGSFLLISLTCCKEGKIQPEPAEVKPEQDVFNVPQSVKDEQDRISSLIRGDEDASEELVIVHKLVKRYYTAPPTNNTNQNIEHRPSQQNEDENGKKPNSNGQQQETGFNAVKGTSFGVKRGEVFSLLGVNGAGKSSTFNCMEGSQRVSGGTILLDGVNVNTYVGRPSKLKDVLGYCPQTNTFDWYLTVRQQLTFFARLSCIQPSFLNAYVMSTIRRFGLGMFADTNAMNLSGGNKRKLSLAMAMIGQPKIIFVDEASTGVDPASRRTMWKAIRHEGKNSAVILTTHAMEEAESISSKIAIQVNGFIRSFGNLEQIKRTSGDISYYVDFNVNLSELMSGFQTEDFERFTSDKDLIVQKLREWSDQASNALGKNQAYTFENEFKPFGLLDRFEAKVNDGQVIDLVNLLSELLMQEMMAGIISEIDRKNIIASVKNYDGAYFSIELTKCKMSFGQLYAFIESIKVKYLIQEYSCKLTSLEEIFNAHATESMVMALNQRLERRRSSARSLQD